MKILVVGDLADTTLLRSLFERGQFDAAYGLKSVCLRYFNAAGADPEGQLW